MQLFKSFLLILLLVACKSKSKNSESELNDLVGPIAAPVLIAESIASFEVEFRQKLEHIGFSGRYCLKVQQMQMSNGMNSFAVLYFPFAGICSQLPKGTKPKITFELEPIKLKNGAPGEISKRNVKWSHFLSLNDDSGRKRIGYAALDFRYDSYFGSETKITEVCAEDFAKACDLLFNTDGSLNGIKLK